MAGFIGFTGFTGLRFGSEPAIAAPTGTPTIVDGTNPGEHPVSPYDIEYQNLDITQPITITYIFTDSNSNDFTDTHSVSLSGEPETGTVSTGSHSVTVPSGDIQLGIEVSHPSLSNTLSTSSSPVTSVSADATIVDDGATVSSSFSGDTPAGQNTISSYDINYNGLDTGSQITVSYVFTDSNNSKSKDTHIVDISGKTSSDTVSTGSHSISVPAGTLELDIKLSHPSLRTTQVTEIGSIGKVYKLGEQGNPAESGVELVQERPNAQSGFYFIQSSQMPNPLEMYVDAQAEGGGYDYYPIQNGFGGNKITDSHSGDSLGLDIVYPRSSEHWESMGRFVRDELNETGSDWDRYFRTCYGVKRNSQSVGGGDYTSFVMRDSREYGSGAPDWGVPDGGRWWLRDSTYSEPNGDYTYNAFLGDIGRDGGFGENSLDEELTFNDGTAAYDIGSYFLVSTNAKP